MSYPTTLVFIQFLQHIKHATAPEQYFLFLQVRTYFTQNILFCSYVIVFLIEAYVALVVKDLSASAGDIRDVGSIHGLGRSPGRGFCNLLQYPCLENPMDRGVW